MESQFNEMQHRFLNLNEKKEEQNHESRKRTVSRSATRKLRLDLSNNNSRRIDTNSATSNLPERALNSIPKETYLGNGQSHQLNGTQSSLVSRGADSQDIRLSNSFHHMGKRKMQKHFTKMNTNFDEISVNQSKIEKKFDSMNRRFEGLDGEYGFTPSLQADSGHKATQSGFSREKDNSGILKKFTEVESIRVGTHPSNESSKKNKYQSFQKSRFTRLNSRSASQNVNVVPNQKKQLIAEPRRKRSIVNYKESQIRKTVKKTQNSMSLTKKKNYNLIGESDGNMFQAYTKVKAKKRRVFDEYASGEINNQQNSVDESGVSITLLKSRMSNSFAPKRDEQKTLAGLSNRCLVHGIPSKLR